MADTDSEKKIRAYMQRLGKSAPSQGTSKQSVPSIHDMVTAWGQQKMAESQARRDSKRRKPIKAGSSHSPVMRAGNIDTSPSHAPGIRTILPKKMFEKISLSENERPTPGSLESGRSILSLSPPSKKPVSDYFQRTKPVGNPSNSEKIIMDQSQRSLLDPRGRGSRKKPVGPATTGNRARSTGVKPRNRNEPVGGQYYTEDRIRELLAEGPGNGPNWHGLGEHQRPIEVIRGKGRNFWDPKTSGEFGSVREALQGRTTALSELDFERKNKLDIKEVDLATQGLRNEGLIDLQKLVNSGALATQQSKNKGGGAGGAGRFPYEQVKQEFGLDGKPLNQPGSFNKATGEHSKSVEDEAAKIVLEMDDMDDAATLRHLMGRKKKVINAILLRLPREKRLAIENNIRSLGGK